MIIAFQQIIGDAVSAEPHAALAWTGVVAILPVSIKSCYLLYLSTLHRFLTPAFKLLLNPVKQTDDADKGLNCITDVLVRFKLVEEAYSEEIDENTKGYFFLILFCVLPL
jgi:hypothetical protein